MEKIYNNGKNIVFLFLAGVGLYDLAVDKDTAELIQFNNIGYKSGFEDGFSKASDDLVSYNDGYGQGLIDAYRNYVMEFMDCVERDDRLSSLEQDYMEVQQSFGLNDSGQLAEFWANTETGTWTFTLTETYRNAIGDVVNDMCLISSGSDWNKTGVNLLNPNGSRL